jgi:acetyltransferase-like isoleucine patch superfamily enzyme
VIVPSDTRAKLGTLPPTVGLPQRYFDRRGCVLDCRGPLVIDRTSQWGFSVVVLTRSHTINEWPGEIGPAVDYGVSVGAHSWIGSGSLLAGCKIGSGVVVAAGSVVRGQTVADNLMVAGNPARVIAKWNGERWVYLNAADCSYERMLE